MDIDWHIGDVIAKLRKKHRMNQTSLAAKVGVNKATIVRAEEGDPKVRRETYMNIARVLGIDLAALEVEAARLGTDANRQSDVSRSHTTGVRPTRAADERDGQPLATVETAPHHGESAPVLGATRPRGGKLRAHARHAVAAIKHEEALAAARAARAPRQPPAAARKKTARSAVRDRKTRG